MYANKRAITSKSDLEVYSRRSKIEIIVQLIALNVVNEIFLLLLIFKFLSQSFIYFLDVLSLSKLLLLISLLLTHLHLSHLTLIILFLCALLILLYLFANIFINHPPTVKLIDLLFLICI